MAEHVIFRDCPSAIKRAVQDYWGQKRDRLDKLLERFPADQRHLRLAVERHLQPERFEVRAVWMLSTGALVAEQSSATYQEALDLAADRLAEAIRRHRVVLQRGASWGRRHRRQAVLAEAAPRFEAGVSSLDKASFFELLRPLLATLHDHAQHELIMAQLEGRLNAGELSVDDVFDDLITRAWDRRRRRPAQLPLEQWLVAMLHEIVDQQSAEAAAVGSLEEPLASDDRRYEASSVWVAENDPFWDEEEELPTLEEVVPICVSEPWQRMARREQHRWLLDQLRRLPRRQRRALTLHVLEGWDEAEVALLQHRPIDEVRDDIETACNLLRIRLAAAEEPHPERI
jgi:DNA-directed RNA polymerase specialized sigma24 family protein/ribosome-associated translation inhibitor RaiA